MYLHKIHHTFGALSAALLLAAALPQAQAGPGVQQIYRPVMTMSQAEALPVGSRIALSCDNGGPVSIFTVDKERSYLKGLMCPVSKRFYRFSPGGSGHNGDQFGYMAKGGYTAHLLTLGKL